MRHRKTYLLVNTPDSELPPWASNWFTIDLRKGKGFGSFFCVAASAQPVNASRFRQVDAHRARFSLLPVARDVAVDKPADHRDIGYEMGSHFSHPEGGWSFRQAQRQQQLIGTMNIDRRGLPGQ